MKVGQTVECNYNGKTIIGTLFAFNINKTKVAIKDGDNIVSVPITDITRIGE